MAGWETRHIWCDFFKTSQLLTSVRKIRLIFLTLGRIQSGMVTIKRMGQVETGAQDRPVDDVCIVKATVEV